MKLTGQTIKKVDFNKKYALFFNGVLTSVDFIFNQEVIDAFRIGNYQPSMDFINRNQERISNMDFFDLSEIKMPPVTN